ncbi:carboxypeptidase-like regulatory domain-containing protein [Nocardioides sp. Iso805N]|uniref:carboxypeptidase-like regulatory domain-containing protein n=1 Tax=Nocardioides sp. Iso805N TaxID=1283287 RepID=UPI0003698B99|nr:carboxypeptidase-like regulatory domain-containing protein [Nocardioides sp. Iso805N]
MRRHHLIGAAAALALAAPTAAIATPALADSATATLDVYVENGTYCCTDLSGASVVLYSITTGRQVGGTVTTDADGSAAFAVPAGAYTAKVSKAGFFTEYSTVTTVTADDVTSGATDNTNVRLDVVPAKPGKIHGHLTTNGGTYVNNGPVYLYAYDATTGYQVAGIYADEDGSGTWGLSVPAGTYKFQVQSYSYDTGSWSYTWVGGDSQADATTYTVTVGGDAVGPTVNLVKATTVLSGKVTDASGKALAGVTAHLIPSAQSGRSAYVAQATTDAAGTYTFNSTVAAGDYRIWFTDNQDEYLDAFYGGTATPVTDPEDGSIPAGATTVTVSSTKTTPATVKLTKGVSEVQTSGIKGIVTDDAGQPLVNASVHLDNEDTNNDANASTGRDGSWHISGADLPPGTYDAQVDGDGSYESAYDLTFTVPVQGVGTAPTIKLLRDGTITGKLTNVGHSKDPFTEGDLQLYNADGDYVDDEGTDEQGIFEFDGVTPGTYYLQARDGDSYDLYGSDHDLIPVYFGGKYSLAGATPIRVTAGGKVTANLTLTDQLMPAGGAGITGTPAAGDTLTAHAGTWSRKLGTSYHYRWTIGSTVVSTSAIYKVGLTDAKKAIKLTVTATNPDWVTGSTSTSVTVAKLTKKQAKQLKKQQKKAKSHKKHKKSKK